MKTPKSSKPAAPVFILSVVCGPNQGYLVRNRGRQFRTSRERLHAAEFTSPKAAEDYIASVNKPICTVFHRVIRSRRQKSA